MSALVARLHVEEIDQPARIRHAVVVHHSDERGPNATLVEHDIPGRRDVAGADVPVGHAARKAHVELLCHRLGCARGCVVGDHDCQPWRALQRGQL